MISAMYDYNTVCKALCMYSIEHSFRTVSKNMNISKSIVHLWNKDMKDGIIRNHTRKSRQTKITPEISQLICTIIKKNPFLTLGDLRRIVFRKYQTKLSEPTISKILRRFKIHRKRVRRVVVKNSNYLKQLKEKRKKIS